MVCFDDRTKEAYEAALKEAEESGLPNPLLP